MTFSQRRGASFDYPARHSPPQAARVPLASRALSGLGGSGVGLALLAASAAIRPEGRPVSRHPPGGCPSPAILDLRLNGKSGGGNPDPISGRRFRSGVSHPPPGLTWGTKQHIASPIRETSWDGASSSAAAFPACLRRLGLRPSHGRPRRTACNDGFVAASGSALNSGRAQPWPGSAPVPQREPAAGTACIFHILLMFLYSPSKASAALS